MNQLKQYEAPPPPHTSIWSGTFQLLWYMYPVKAVSAWNINDIQTYSQELELVCFCFCFFFFGKGGTIIDAEDRLILNTIKIKPSELRATAPQLKNFLLIKYINWQKSHVKIRTEKLCWMEERKTHKVHVILSEIMISCLSKYPPQPWTFLHNIAHNMYTVTHVHANAHFFPADVFS